MIPFRDGSGTFGAGIVPLHGTVVTASRRFNRVKDANPIPRSGIDPAPFITSGANPDGCLSILALLDYNRNLNII